MMIDRSTAVSTTHRRRMPPAGWSLCPQPGDGSGDPTIANPEAVEKVEPSGEAGGEVSPATEGEAALPVTGPAKN
jgi:hypothetical protein